MKISIVVGGRWHAFDLAQELHRVGYLYRLITSYPKFKTRAWGIPDEKVISLPRSLYLSKLVYKLGQEPLRVRFQYFLHQMFNKAAVQHLSGSDLIHGWSSFSLPALTWAKRHSIPFVLERSSSHMLVQCQLLQEEYLSLGLTWPATHPKIVEQELAEYDLADRIAVPSLFVKRSFLNQGIAEQHLIHNPFGTNLKSFPIGNKQDNIFRVIYVGSLSIRKGIHYLLQAFNQANIPSSELLLVGGATKNTPKLLADADERVRCTGHVPQHTLFNYYQQSTVFVMASLEEGLAYVQAQAMASGLPLICTTNTGGEDLLRLSGNPTQLDGDIEEYPAGYLVPIRNSQAISVCLQLLAQNPKLLRSKRGAALTIRESDLSWGSYAARAMEFYREILN